MGEEPNKVTFSLPELTHGYNGYQIKNEEEYDAALQKAREYIEEVATFSHVKEITRLDVAYNISVENPRMLLSVLRHFKLTRARKRDDSKLKLCSFVLVFGLRATLCGRSPEGTWSRGLLRRANSPGV